MTITQLMLLVNEVSIADSFRACLYRHPHPGWPTLQTALGERQMRICRSGIRQSSLCIGNSDEFHYTWYEVICCQG
jgi:hypothetical protein